MMDPIYATELADIDVCSAHLLPKAICPSSLTIPSNRSFDNEFGHHNDCHLVRFIANHLNGEEDVEIDVLDPDDHNRTITTFRHLKNIPNVDHKTGIREGSFEKQFPPKTSDEWREKHLSEGKLFKMRIVEPEYHRIELSMLHSGFLTICYHFGTSHLDCEGSRFVRHVLQKSISDNLNSDLEELCRALTFVRKGISASQRAVIFYDAAQKAITRDPHPLMMVRIGVDCCLMPVLPYNDMFISVTILPGFEHNSMEQWISVISQLSQGDVTPTIVAILTPFTSQESAVNAYHEMAEAFRKFVAE